MGTSRTLLNKSKHNFLSSLHLSSFEAFLDSVTLYIIMLHARFSLSLSSRAFDRTCSKVSLTDVNFVSTPCNCSSTASFIFPTSSLSSKSWIAFLSSSDSLQTISILAFTSFISEFIFFTSSSNSCCFVCISPRVSNILMAARPHPTQYQCTALSFCRTL